MLQPASPTARRERILLMGPFGSGKTTSWLNVAKWSHETGSDAQFYAIDTDGALEAFVEPGSDYDLPNVHVYNAYEWDEYKEAKADIEKKITNDDWLIVDFISNAWSAVQESYIERVFQADVDEFFLEARKALKGGNPLEGWKDWSVINRMYKQWVNQIVHRTPGHKLFTAKAVAIRENDDRSVKATFGSHGVRPDGQKELGHIPHTILLTQVVRSGEIYVTTIKDREREAMEGKPLNDFTIDYLVGVAGWQL